jgi:hypothetical protein
MFSIREVFVARVDLANRLEQDTARNAGPGGGLGDTIVRGLHVLRGQLGAVVELYALTQMERVGLAIRGNLLAMRQIGYNRLGAIVGIAPDQIVEHAGCGPKNEDGVACKSHHALPHLGQDLAEQGRATA